MSSLALRASPSLGPFSNSNFPSKQSVISLGAVTEKFGRCFDRDFTRIMNENPQKYF